MFRVSVRHPQGALSLPVGEVHVRFKDGTYKNVASCDVCDDELVEAILKHSIREDEKDDILDLIFVDRTANRYYAVYPVFSPYYFDLSYIDKELKEQKGRKRYK